jgi:SAM-dependent methyltransferase
MLREYAVRLRYARRMTGSEIASEYSGIRVNVGCGLSPTPEWLNFDNSFSVRVARWPLVLTLFTRLGLLSANSAELAKMTQHGHVKFANAAARIPCASGSVAAVYSSHMIEHLDRSEALVFLAEVRRVLAPGGVVRIAAPDLSLLIRDYGLKGDADEFVGGLHMGLNRPTGLAARAKWALVGPRHHLWMYDGESLARLLCQAGFTDTAVIPPGATMIAQPGQLDLAERAEESVYVEAVRPH